MTYLKGKSENDFAWLDKTQFRTTNPEDNDFKQEFSQNDFINTGKVRGRDDSGTILFPTSVVFTIPPQVLGTLLYCGETEMGFVVRLVDKHNKPLTESDMVAPINLFGYAYWRKVEMKWNDHVVYSVPSEYGLIKYL